MIIATKPYECHKECKIPLSDSRVNSWVNRTEKLATATSGHYALTPALCLLSYACTVCRNFHVINGPRGVHYIYTPAGCKSTAMQAFFVCVGSVEGEGEGVIF